MKRKYRVMDVYAGIVCVALLRRSVFLRIEGLW